jgi:hypothetical protein
MKCIPCYIAWVARETLVESNIAWVVRDTKLAVLHVLSFVPLLFCVLYFVKRNVNIKNWKWRCHLSSPYWVFSGSQASQPNKTLSAQTGYSNQMDRLLSRIICCSLRQDSSSSSLILFRGRTSHLRLFCSPPRSGSTRWVIFLSIPPSAMFDCYTKIPTIAVDLEETVTICWVRKERKGECGNVYVFLGACSSSVDCFLGLLRIACLFFSPYISVCIWIDWTFLFGLMPLVTCIVSVWRIALVAYPLAELNECTRILNS